MKEIKPFQLIKALTLKRVFNSLKVGTSYIISRITRRGISWGYPMVLTVEPTNRCNLRCPLCYTGSGKLTRPPGNMSFETFRRIINELGDYIFYLLLYNQGEPYLNEALLEFIEYAKSRRIYVTTSTNGHFFEDQHNVRRTITSGLDSLIISLDGADEETYAQYRQGGDFSRVVRGIKNLTREKRLRRSLTPRIYLQFLVMQHNEAKIGVMRALARELGVDRLLLKTMQIENAEEAAKFLPSQPKYRRYRINDGQLELKKGANGSCHRPWTSSVVNWDGSVVPCCFDKNGRYNFGTVAESLTFTEIWRSERYARFRAKILSEGGSFDICRNCTQGLAIYL